MKYVVLIYANPQPWGHPTAHFTLEGRQVPQDVHQQMDQAFEELLNELSESGELVAAQALGDPAEATIYGWRDGQHVATDGPFAETKEQLAGFFQIDCSTRERAEEVAAQFAQPGGWIELRPVM
jgi:hypothetical protein